MRKRDKLKVIQEANQRLEEKAIGFKTAGDNRVQTLVQKKLN